MPLATLLRSFNLRLPALLVVFAALVSSCQSSRPGFSFQPAPGRARAVAVAKSVAIVMKDSATATVSMPATAASRPTFSRPAPVIRLRQGHPQQPRLLAPVAAETQVVTPAPAVAHRRGLLHRAHGTADSGFGMTVLGLLGLVALAVGLIGLAISGGGLGWAIVVGVAALIVLIAYIDPHRR